MDDIKSYGLTLEELESKLIQGRSLSDDENDQTIEPDEYDVMNDETFGANVDDIICDAELESYAAQTAKLRLDDSVWEQSIAPDVSDIPLPVWDFPTGLDSFANNQSIWSNSINDSAKNYSLWQPLSSVAENESEEWPKESDFFKESGEVPDKKIASKNEPIPQHAMSITEIEKLMLNDELVKKQFEDYDSPSPVVTQSAPPSQPHELPMSNETSNNLASLGLQPIHPSSALTIDQIEAEMLKQQAAPSPRKAARTPKPENSRNDYRQQQVQPGQFMSHMNMLPPMPLLPLPINPMVIASIPPLPPHLLQCLPVWIHAIVTNSKPPNLPNDFPPPPFFLTDLMNVFKDPNLVSTLVVQASSLPFRQPLPPQLHPQLPQQIIESRPQSRMTNNTEFSRANSSLPSDRVIKDLAFDSFAGYMSCKEREWLVKIQIHQMQGCGDPLVEDYYYVKWKEAKIAAGCTSNPKVHNQKSQKVELYSEREMRLRYVEKRNRENNIRAVRDAKERESKKEEIEKEKAADRELRINTTLGKLTKPTKHNPRKQVVVKSEGRESPAHAPLTDDAKRQLVTKKLRTMLLRLELYLTSLMEAAELDSQKLSEKSRFAELTPEERAVQAAEKIEFVIKDISGSDFFKILQMSKGRRLVQRLLAATSAKDQARLILSLFMAVPLLNSKYHEEVCKEVILVLYRALAAWTRDQLNSLLSVIDLTSVSKTNAKENKVLRDLLFSITFACYKKSANRPEKILALIHSAKFSLQLKDWTSVVLLPETELEGFSRYITSK